MIVDKSNDQFPVGMRVLAVDDDPICLRVLDTLLRKCQYHVTTTNQAITAVNLLRENRKQFDLVISDVHMPDMDGFKLLELVGLEMDLPVIMLSANGDTKLVMKGITHGACDYLLKPVRIEELKNIWQHVIRRKHNDQKNQREEVEDGQANRFSDQNSKLINRKRKDQDGDEDDENVENGYAEDTLNQKRPRVVWTVDLHRKFVSAVNQLGIDKAVPKKVLDLMNVEKLTRENVASHLQKYRLYLSRISHHHQANMPMDLSGFDSPFLRMTSLRGPSWLQNPASGHVQFGHNTQSRMVPIRRGQPPLDFQKGILGFSHHPSNWQTQIHPSMAMTGSRSNIVHQNMNSSVLTQGWNIGIGINNPSHAQSNLFGGGLTDSTTMIQGMEPNNSLVFESGNDFRCFGDPFSTMSNNDILQPSSHMDQRKTQQNGFSSDANNNKNNDNVWSLEDLIKPIINQVPK